MEMPGRQYIDNQAVRPYTYGFNGQEKENELNEQNYDFGARICESRIGRFLSIDAHAYKYADITPYNYTFNSPISFVDIDGNDGILSGSGTKKDPYIVKATYFHYGLNKNQTDGLNGAIGAYNRNGKSWKIRVDGKKIFVKFDLAAKPVKDVEEAKKEVNNTYVETGEIDKTGQKEEQRYGNIVSTGENLIRDNIFKEGTKKGDLGYGNTMGVGIVEAETQDFLEEHPTGVDKKGGKTLFNYIKLAIGIFTHEIGHNLTGVHGDAGKIMKKMEAIGSAQKDVSASGSSTTLNYSEPSTPKPIVYKFYTPEVTRKGVKAMFQKFNKSTTDGDGGTVKKIK
jgi:RHS repeat-associated protein